MISPSLEEMAAAYERGRQQLEDADAEVARLAAPLDEAKRSRDRLRRAMELLEAGMETVKRDEMIRRAIREDGVETDDPAVILVGSYHGPPKRYELVAVAEDGTGLYRYEQVGKTYSGKRRVSFRDHAVRIVRAGEKDHGYVDTKMSDAGLRTWEERGRGQWGAGSGPLKQKPPPAGGRWRWLKLREQEALEAPIT